MSPGSSLTVPYCEGKHDFYLNEVFTESARPRRTSRVTIFKPKPTNGKWAVVTLMVSGP